MVKKLLLLLAVFGAFYAHARFSFAEPRVMSWVGNHSAKAMSGDNSACDDYTDDVAVALTSKATGGTWEVEGGKDEICGYLKQAAAAFTVLQASTHSEFDQVRIVRSGFPWLSAKVSYVERTTVQAGPLPTMLTTSEDALVLVRTFAGIRIKSIESKASVAPAR
jgi:hypothetical protein